MRKLLSFIVLLCMALGVSAQSWTAVDATKYNHETIVYADLDFNIPNASINDFTIGAFVNDECRASVSTPTTGNNQSFFVLNVRGDKAKDQGTEIKFKAYYNATGAEYDLTAEPVVMFDGESHISPSNRIKLTLTAATEISISNFEVNVGQTVNLLDFVTITPEGASLPTNYRWNIDGSNLATLDGDNLTGVEMGGDPIKLQVPKTTPNGTTWNDIATGYFTVVNHITAITAHVTEVTVNVGDNITFEDNMLVISNGTDEPKEIEDFITITPEDHTDILEFVITDGNALELEETALNAVAAGTAIVKIVTKDVDGNVLVESAPITFTVRQPVTAINLSAQSITTSTAMEELTRRIQELITVYPETATDKSYTITSSNPNVVRIENDGESFTAYNEQVGNATLTITANDGSGVTAQLNVIVEGAATKVEFATDPLVVTITSVEEPTDITQQILDNITIPEYPDYANVTISVSGEGPVTGEAHITPNGSAGILYAQEEGTSNINVTVLWNDWDHYQNTGEVQTTGSNYGFVVQVKVEIPLEGFSAEYIHNANGDGGSLILTPVPENATYNASDINVEILCPFDANEEWQNAVKLELVYKTDNKLDYDVKTPTPGEYFLYVSSEAYEDLDVNAESINVPDALTLNNGWQWRSNPYGDIASGADAVNNMEEVFQGNNFYEARTQYDLVINDPEWGYFGTLLNAGLPQNSCFKIKMQDASKAPSLLWDGELVGGGEVTLVPGWNWVAYPYFYNHKLNEVLMDSTLPAGLQIISKEDGFAEWNGTSWEGSLSVLVNHEGYLILNPSEEEIVITFDTEFFNFSPVNDDADNGVKGQAPELKVWKYDASQFMSNMIMVAELPEISNPDNCSIGAFVGDECRGEGVIINGKAFITIHTDGGEEVSLKLYNELLGEYFDIDETFQTQSRLGSLKAPVQLHSTPFVTAINGVSANGSAAESYDLSGRRTNGQQRGITIQRMADGTVRKVLVK